MEADEHVVAIKGQLSAEAIVDAHLAARAAGKPLTIHHEGTPTSAALRTAARFGATLVDRTQPEPVAPEASIAVAPSPAPAPPTLIDDGSPALPWDLATQAPEPAAVVVPEDEFEAMPWNIVDNVLLPAGRRTRAAAARPTLTPPDWGLPWPRPMAPMDGISKADPNLWRAPERLQAIREDLERAGAPSFGVAKPEAGASADRAVSDQSAWLKRLSEFGSP